MANFAFRFDPELSWKTWSAVVIFSMGFAGLLSGVGVSERSGLPDTDLLTKAYYALGLFVLGGMDLGTPTSGPRYGQLLLWIAYFAAPVWTASAVFETILNALRPPIWRIINIKKKIVIFGGGQLTIGFLDKMTASGDRPRVTVIVRDQKDPNLDTLRSYRGVKVFVVSVDQMHRVRLHPLQKATKFLLLSENDEINFELASILLDHDPQLGPKIVYHVSNLRFLRVLADSNVVRLCTTFNQFELAATQLAREQLIQRFRKTPYRETVVLAGFGRFGQSILEQLERRASGEFERVAIFDLDAKQQAGIFDEQMVAEPKYGRHLFNGDIDDPEVWRHLLSEVVTENEEPIFILTTDDSNANLRCAIWLRKRFKNALIISRTQAPSCFAKAICDQHNVVSVNTAELVQTSIPHAWYRG